MRRQGGNVLNSVTQRRQAQTDDIQAMVEVLSKLSALDAFFQILVRRGNDANIGLNGLVTAYAVKVPVGEYTQKPSLQLHRHIADFIQKERAALGLLKAAQTRGHRTGERAFFVAKQFTFEQFSRDGRHVDRNVRGAAAAAVLPNGTRNDLLARSGLSGEQHGDVALRKPSDGTKNFLHGWRLTNQIRHRCRGFFHRRGCRRCTLCGRACLTGRRMQTAAAGVFHGSADEFNSLQHIKGLGQIFKRTALKGGNRTFQVREGRHDNDRQFRHELLHLREEIHTRETRHTNVGNQNEGKLSAHGLRGLERIQSVLTALKGAAANAGTRKRTVKHPADCPVIINHPNGFAAGIMCAAELPQRRLACAAARCRLSCAVVRGAVKVVHHDLFFQCLSSAFQSVFKSDSLRTFAVLCFSVFTRFTAFKRQQYREVRPAGTAFERNASAGFLHKGLYQCESEARALRTAGHQREKDALLQVLRHPRTVIDDINTQCCTGAGTSEHHIARNACFKNNDGRPVSATFRHGLCGVARKVQKDLRETAAVTENGRRRNVVITLNREPLGKFKADKAAHMFEYFMNIDRAGCCRRPIRHEESVNQFLQSCRFFKDDVRAFTVFVTHEFALKQLRRTADAAQGILDFVC